MILFDQASIKRFISTTSYKNQAGGFELGKWKDNGSCVDINAGNGFVAFFVSAVMNTGRIINKAVTMKFEKDFTTGHVFETAVRLAPIPFSAQSLGNLGA
jgi:hypothetical protein